MDDQRTFKDSYREHLLLGLKDDEELVAQAQQVQQRETLPIGQAVDTIGSAILSSIPAGWAGIIGGLREAVRTDGDIDAAVRKAVEEIQRVQEAGMIMPTTEEGMQATEEAASAMEVLGVPADYLAEKVFEATGSPGLATATNIFADPVNLALGGGAALAARSAKTAGKAARSAMEEPANPMPESDIQDAFMGVRAGGREGLPDPRQQIVTDAGKGKREMTGAWVTKSEGQAHTYTATGDVVPVQIDTRDFATVNYAPDSSWMLAREGTTMTLPDGQTVDVSGRSTNDIARYARENNIAGVKFVGLMDVGGSGKNAPEVQKLVSEYKRGGPVDQYVVIDASKIWPKKESKGSGAK